MNKIKGIIGLLILMTGLISCKTSKQTIVPIPEVSNKETAEIFKVLKDNEFQYEWFKIKFDATVITDKRKISLNGQLRIRKDSLIWISISPAMGIEVGRMMISPDSIFMLDRINSTYLKESIAAIKTVIDADVDFDMLQAFITGNDFAHYSTEQFKSKMEKDHYFLSTFGRNKLRKASNDTAAGVLLEDIYLSLSNHKIIKHRIKDVKDKNRKFEAEYLSFNDVNGQLFPKELNIEISAKQQIKLIFKFQKPEMISNIDFPFNIPQKYNPLISDKKN